MMICDSHAVACCWRAIVSASSKHARARGVSDRAGELVCREATLKLLNAFIQAALLNARPPPIHVAERRPHDESGLVRGERPLFRLTGFDLGALVAASDHS